MDIFEKKFESVGGGPSVGLKDKLFHGYETEYASVVWAYNRLFTIRKKLDHSLNVPPPLAPLLALMEHCKRNGQGLLTNGAGKQFVCHLLNLCFILPEKWLAKTSTTSNPKSDWCGLNTQKAGPQVCGIPDVLLEDMDGLRLLVAEVKSGVSVRNASGSHPAECQLIAELQLLWTQQHYPALGLLVDPVQITLYVSTHVWKRLRVTSTNWRKSWKSSIWPLAISGSSGQRHLL